MEPCGNGNPSPILAIKNVAIVNIRYMGAEGQHMKIEVVDKNSKKLQMLAFNTDKDWKCEVGDEISLLFEPTINEWNGLRSVEGRLLNIEKV